MRSIPSLPPHLVATVLLWTAALPGLGAEELSETQLDAIKSKTVLLLVTTLEGTEYLGSGFIIARDPSLAYIVTTEHVAYPDHLGAHVDVVLGSGTAQERLIHDAYELGRDSLNDLALLGVASDRMPEPLTLADTHKLHETEAVFIAGFPFGDDLTASSRHPGITIGQGIVSSLRCDDAGNVAIIQLDSAINPGNSGGPVLAQDGTVIGMAEADLRTAHFGFAIPGRTILASLDGRPCNLNLTSQRESGGKVTVKALVQVMDPFGKDHAVSVVLVPKDALPEPASGPVPLAKQSSAALAFALDRGLNGYTGTFTLSAPRGGGVVDYWTQAVANADTPLYSACGAMSADFGGEGPAVVDPGANIAAYNLALPDDGPDLSVPLPKPVTDLAIAGDGRYLVLACEQFTGLMVYDADQHRISQTIRLPTDNFVFAAGGDTVLVATPEDGLLTSYSIVTGQRIASKPVPFPGTVVSMVMGRGRADRALLRIGSSRPIPRYQLHMVNVLTLADIPFTRARVRVPNEITPPPPPIGMPGYQSGRDNPLVADDLVRSARHHLRSNADLTEIGEWTGENEFSPICRELISIKGTQIELHHSSPATRQVGAIIPGQDGLVYSLGGSIFDSQFKPKYQLEHLAAIAGVSGDLYLGLDFQGSISVFRSGEHTPICSLLAFPDGSIQPSDELSSEPQTRSPPFSSRGPGQQPRNPYILPFSNPTDLTIDKRLVFDPAHGRLILITAGGDHLIQRPFNIKTLLQTTGKDYLLPLSHPPSTIPRGKPFTFQIQAICRDGRVTCELQSGPPGMTVSPTGLIRWTPSSDAGARESVIILIKDDAHDSQFYNFDLSIGE